MMASDFFFYDDACRSTFFNRKDPVLVEERRQACQDLLEFAATFPALFSSPAFKAGYFANWSSCYQGRTEKVMRGWDEIQGGGCMGCKNSQDLLSCKNVRKTLSAVE